MATSNTDAKDSAPAIPTTHSVTNQVGLANALYHPIGDEIRTYLEQAVLENSHKAKEIGAVLFSFEMVHAHLQDLMREEGFFAAFTEEQKLWYIDAVLHDRFWMKLFRKDKYKVPCPPDRRQLSTPAPQASTPAQAGTGQTHNGKAPPHGPSANNSNTATVARQKILSETGANLANSACSSTSAPLRASHSEVHTQDLADSGKDVSALGNQLPSETQRFTSKLPYYANEGVSRTHAVEFPVNAQPILDLQMNSSLFRRRQTSAAARAIQQHVGLVRQSSDTPITTPQANLQRGSVSGDTINTNQLQLSPSINDQQPLTRPVGAPLMTDRLEHNAYSSGATKMPHHSPHTMHAMTASGPSTMSLPPYSITGSQHSKGYGHPSNTTIVLQGSSTQLGNNLSGSPILGQNPYVQNNGYNCPQMNFMRARSQSQNDGQQNNPLSNFNDHYGFQPSRGSGLRNDSEYTTAGQHRQQDTHQLFNSSCMIPASAQLQSPQPTYFMGIPLDPDGSPLHHPQPSFRPSPSPVSTQNHSHLGHGHGHSRPQFNGKLVQPQPRHTRSASFSPMHPQVQSGAQMIRTNSAPPAYAQPGHQNYWSNGHGKPTPKIQGGYPMVRGNGSAKQNHIMRRQYLLPEDQARLESGFNRKRDLDQFSEGAPLDQGLSKR
ncbi:hypothetical protein BKA65DRAFT_482924 [Rhexocercosporidium sp. MPI-PUGE-AT-0058]|nr:hypothetical protein BKA65DRAFT_482924 [Rhexocercosporidium sp. MPI-PUGE-AT-0058]